MQNSSYFIENRALFGSFPKQQHVDELVDRGVRYFVDLTQSDEARIVPYQVPNQCQKTQNVRSLQRRTRTSRNGGFHLARAHL
jgi:hypothetical protein